MTTVPRCPVIQTGLFNYSGKTMRVLALFFKNIVLSGRKKLKIPVKPAYQEVLKRSTFKTDQYNKKGPVQDRSFSTISYGLYLISR